MHPLHPMIVHFPIALLTAAVGFDLVGTHWRPNECRIATRFTLVLGFTAAVLALLSGHLAEEAVEHSGVPKAVLELHETLAGVTTGVFAVLVALHVAVSMGWVRERRGLAVAVGLVGVVLLLIASYYGGSLVYEYGAGVVPPSK